MKILLLNQTFHPDVVSTAQHLKDLALGLAEKGHEVTVLCSNRAYDDVQKRFPSRERWKNIEIHRVGSLGLGKSAKWKRAADFASFFVAATFKTLRLPRHDVVIALTSPPLISLLGAQLAKRWRGRFLYWVMDLNPDEAIAAGWLRPNSLPAKVLNWISAYSLRRAEKIIVLDRFMQQRIEAKGIAANKIEIIPPWSHDDEVKVDLVGRVEFRKQHGLENKFVVMYSGNHSPCHPLDTLLEAAQQLSGEKEIVFCFVGGGSEWRRIRNCMEKSEVRNQHSEVRSQGSGVRSQESDGKTLNSRILCLPYQPLEKLSASLSAADLHVVVMGDSFVGTIHPCKVYNVLNMGIPILYIGPVSGHVPDIFKGRQCGESFYAASHGNGKAVAENIRCARERKTNLPVKEIQEIGRQFAKDVWLPRFISLVERRD